MLKYYIHLCKDCDNEFITRRGNCCPECSDSIYVEKVRTIWKNRLTNKSRRWTDDEDHFLHSAVDQGLTHRQIAKELGRTKDAVSVRLARLRKEVV